MANEQSWNFDVPTQMRQFAEQSVEQARKAVDGFMVVSFMGMGPLACQRAAGSHQLPQLSR